MSDGPTTPPKSHCPTCACDPSAPQAIERTKRVAKDSMMFVLLTDAAAHTRLLTWWRENREEHRGQPRRLKGEFVAHKDQLEIVIQPPPPPAESYRRRRRRTPE